MTPELCQAICNYQIDENYTVGTVEEETTCAEYIRRRIVDFLIDYPSASMLDMIQAGIVFAGKCIKQGYKGRGKFSARLGEYGMYDIGDDEWCTSFADWCYVIAIRCVLNLTNKQQCGRLARALTVTNSSTTGCCTWTRNRDIYVGPPPSDRGQGSYYYYSASNSPSPEYAGTSLPALLGGKVYIGWSSSFQAVHTGVLIGVQAKRYIETAEGNTDDNGGVVKRRTGSSGFASNTSWGRVVALSYFDWDKFLQQCVTEGIDLNSTPTESLTIPEVVSAPCIRIGSQLARPYIYTNGGWVQAGIKIYQNGSWKS